MAVKEFEPLYTVKEAAKVLKTNTNEVYKLINKGLLPRLIIGSYKIRGKDLEKFIDEQVAIQSQNDSVVEE